MKVITILQPYALLIALGEKHIETRGWQSGYCGPLLIHAGKSPAMLPECPKSQSGVCWPSMGLRGRRTCCSGSPWP